MSDESDQTPDSRYARQMQFGPIGVAGQQRLCASDVVVLGCGALGTVAAEILARAGVGTIRLIDRDVVEWTNLQRQALFDESDAELGRSKVEAASKRLSEINSSIRIVPEVADIVADNISRVLADADLVIDASDNFALRFLLNDWSLKMQTPWVHGGCVGAVGQVRLFTGSGSPCFRCLVPRPPPPASVATCDTAGVVGAATHAIASLQAMEAIKWLSGDQTAVNTNVVSIDFWNNRMREFRIDAPAHDRCRACREHRFDFLEGGHPGNTDRAGRLCGRDAVQIAAAPNATVDLQHLAQRWEKLGRVQRNKFFTRLFPDDRFTLTMFRDGRVVVTGTRQLHEARSLYARYVGG